MMNEENVLTVQILDRPYKIKCLPKDVLDLQEAARYVDSEMKKIRQTSHAIPHDRLAVVAALNICNELFQEKKLKNQYVIDTSQRIADLQRRIGEKLAAESETVV